MMLTDLISATVGRLFHAPPPPIQGRQKMLIPNIKDIRNSLQSAKVQAQCAECARLLASHLYRWKKPYPEKSTVKSWSTESQSFLGMDISLFQQYLIQHFSLR